MSVTALPAERPTRLDLSWPILIAFAAILIALIVLPMSWLVYFSVTDKAGGFTLQNFVTLVTDPTFTNPLLTTVILATSSADLICARGAAPGVVGVRPRKPLGPPGRRPGARP